MPGPGRGLRVCKNHFRLLKAPRIAAGPEARKYWLLSIKVVTPQGGAKPGNSLNNRNCSISLQPGFKNAGLLVNKKIRK